MGLRGLTACVGALLPASVSEVVTVLGLPIFGSCGPEFGGVDVVVVGVERGCCDCCLL